MPTSSRFAQRSTLLVCHPAASLRRLHAQMREWASGAAQPEPVRGHTAAMQHRGPGERLAQLPQVRPVSRGLLGQKSLLNVKNYR